MGKIPDRWLDYNSMGEPIPGTRFISFKVPLKQALCQNLHVHERFTPEMLMESCPKLGLVVDLTNTNRYYNGQVFISKGIQYKKIHCPGQVIPKEDIVKNFFSVVDAYLNESNEKDTLIGVHCTHGLNRTGYFICRYMSLRMGFKPEDAISAFEKARGYKMERELYKEDIVAGKELTEERKIKNSRDIWNDDEQESYNQLDRSNHRSWGKDDHIHQNKIVRNKYKYSEERSQFSPQAPVFEFPLAESPYNDYDVPSRYSRSYGSSYSDRGGYANDKRHRDIRFSPYDRHRNGMYRKPGPYSNQSTYNNSYNNRGTKFYGEEKYSYPLEHSGDVQQSPSTSFNHSNANERGNNYTTRRQRDNYHWNR